MLKPYTTSRLSIYYPFSWKFTSIDILYYTTSISWYMILSSDLTSIDMNTIEIWIMFVNSPSFIRSPEASAALADLSCARSVVSGLRSPRSWVGHHRPGGNILRWTRCFDRLPLGLVTGVHVSCLKHVAESYLMLFKFAQKIWWWFWNDVGWLKIIKHH